MRSYLDILDELSEIVESDIIPQKEKESIRQKIQELFNMLWPYLD